MTSSSLNTDESEIIDMAEDSETATEETVTCDRCGHSMFRMRAVYWCDQCGYKTDCCGH